VMTRKARSLAALATLPVLVLLLLCLFAALDLPVVPHIFGASAPHKLKPTDRYALIFGTVWGPDNHPLYGVKVKIRRARDKKPRWELTSDHAGEFAQRVPAGKVDYIVWADLRGVKTENGRPLRLAEEVPVHVVYDERVDIGLHLTSH
jgi:hypothetical protein